jgi:hypothetical protein
MAATTAVKAGIISAATGLVLVVGALAVSSTIAGAQTPSPTPTTPQQQTTPSTPQQTPDDGTTPAPKGEHNGADCPKDGTGSGGSGMGRGSRGTAPESGTTPEDGSTSSSSSFSGARGGPRF